MPSVVSAFLSVIIRIWVPIFLIRIYTFTVLTIPSLCDIIFFVCLRALLQDQREIPAIELIHPIFVSKSRRCGKLITSVEKITDSYTMFPIDEFALPDHAALPWAGSAAEHDRSDGRRRDKAITDVSAVAATDVLRPYAFEGEDVECCTFNMHTLDVLPPGFLQRDGIEPEVLFTVDAVSWRRFVCATATQVRCHFLQDLWRVCDRERWRRSSSGANAGGLQDDVAPELRDLCDITRSAVAETQETGQTRTLITRVLSFVGR